MCKDPEFSGVIGLAWVGTLCTTSMSGYNAGVNEKRQNVLATSEVLKKIFQVNYRIHGIFNSLLEGQFHFLGFCPKVGKYSRVVYNQE